MIYGAVGIVLILVYVFLVKKSPEQQNLVSISPSGIASDTTDTLDQNSSISKDLLSVLLSVKSIKLDDSIFSDKAFINLRDSTIVLAPPGPGEEGRSNPFAPIGVELNAVPVAPTTPPEAPSMPPDTISIDTAPITTIDEDTITP